MVALAGGRKTHRIQPAGEKPQKQVVKTALVKQGVLIDEKDMARTPVFVGESGRLSAVVNIDTYFSWDSYGDVSNDVPVLDLAVLLGLPSGTAVTMTGIGWDVVIDTTTPGQGSYLSEATMYFDDNIAPDGSGLHLSPGAADASVGIGYYNSGGILDLTDNGIPDIILCDGMLRLEFYESYDDADDAIDGNYTDPAAPTFVSNITIEGEALTGVGACCDDATQGCVTTGMCDCMAAGYTWFEGEDCGSFTCPAAVLGDNCAAPIVVDFATDLPFSDIAQTTCGRGHDYDGVGCLGSYDTGEEIMYELVNVPADTCVNIVMTSDTTWTGMGIDAECPPGAACVEETNSGTDESILGLILAAGTHYLQLDTYTSPDCIGSFDLSIELCPLGGACCHGDGSCDDVSSAGDCVAAGDLYQGDGTSCATVICPSPGDDCTNPQVVTLGVVDLPYIDDNTNCGRGDFHDDASSDHCLYYYDSGEDMIYELDVTEEMTVRVGLDPHGTTYPGVAIGDACPPTDSCLAADYHSSSDPLDTGCVTLSPGTYYIQVDTWSSPDCIPDFTLTVSECPAGGACCHGDETCDDVSGSGDCIGTGDTYMGDGTTCATVTCPPPNDQCPGTKISCDETLTGQSTVGTNNDYDDTGACTGYNQPGADVAYELTMPFDGDVTITVQNVSGFDPAFYVVTDCANPVACIAGADAGYTGDDETTTFTAAAGTYFIIVDTYSSSGQGTFDLDVTCVEALDGACCLGGGSCILDTANACGLAGGSWAGPETDCAGSGAGGGTDCDSNGYIDFCDLYDGGADCQPNGVLDECDVPPIGSGADCQGDGIPDECQLAGTKGVVVDEGFEGGVIPPSGWTAVVNNSYTWEIDSYDPYAGMYNASCFYDPALGTQDEWMLSPELNMSGNVTLSGYSLGSVSWMGNYDLEAWVVIGPGANDGDDILLGQIDEETWPSDWVWTPFSYVFAAPTTPFRVAFRYYGSDGAQASLDAITVEGETGPLANDCNDNGVPDECDDPTCGNDCLEGGEAGYPAEECDGTLDDACPGECYPPGHPNECTCAFCGDGVVGDGEDCDGGACCTAGCTFEPDTLACNPSSGVCDPAEYCTGADADCPANVTITACIDGDGCCPAGCDANDDNDCVAVCGNNIAEPGEQCDGTDDAACPGACDGCACPQIAIPTLSHWGLMILGLAMLIGARVYFRRRSVHVAG